MDDEHLTRLRRIEDQLAQLQRPKAKDAWAKLESAAIILIPASIALVGTLVTKAHNSRQDSIAVANMQLQEQATEASNRIDEAKLVPAFLEALSGNNDRKQKLAAAVAPFALPSVGPKLLLAISEQDLGASGPAKVSLDSARARLVTSVFAQDKATRVDATVRIIQGWSSDSELLRQLLEHAAQNTANLDGIVNTLVVLQNVDKRLLSQFSPEINALFSRAEGNGDVTRAQIQAVRARMSK